MAGFTDLVPKAQPYICSITSASTVGTTWRHVFTGVEDDNGDPIDLTEVTAACDVLDAPAGQVLASFAFTGGIGEFTLELDSAASINLATDALVQACWRLTLTSGTDVVRFWGPTSSPFMLYPN